MLRGGQAFITPGSEDINLNFMTDQSKKVWFYLGGYLGLGDVKSYKSQEFSLGTFVRPLNSFSISLEPSYSIQNNKLQFVSTQSAGNGNKYIFAELDQKTVSFTMRLNYTINPDLTIEYYGQPFVSDGKYKNFKRITQPDAKTFKERYHQLTEAEISYIEADNEYLLQETGIESYTVSNPDFNFRQFRSNLVIRWEYLPGSTLYLVWSQGRTHSDNNGIFSYKTDMRELFDTTPHNVFLIKLSYWFSM
jgi:hypothetical protein